MARAKKPKTIAVRKPMDPEQAARIRRVMLHTLAAIAFVALLSVGLFFDRRYVDQKIVPATMPPRVVLKNRPTWMSDFLAEQIAKSAKPAGTHSAFDHQLLVDTVSLLHANPWIAQVKQVRRAYGAMPGDTLEVDCDYRAPVALVHWKDYFWLVDGEGVKLPEAFSAADVPRIVIGQDKKMNIRVIEGVREAPPESGTKWTGEDLHAGLELVKLLYGRSYAEEVEKVDVTNLRGRKDPKTSQILLITRYNTEVRWGEPVTVGEDSFFAEVSPAQKLAYMKATFEQYGRVDAKFPWVDIRFDQVTSPSLPQSAQPAQASVGQ